MKKVVLSVAAGVAIILVLYIVLGLVGLVQFPRVITDWLAGSNKQLTDLERIPKLITKTYPTDIVILGNKISFEVDVPTRTIDQVAEETLQKKDGCKYIFLIINDLDNCVQLTDQNIALIAEMIENDNFCLVYLGEKYATNWNDPDQYVANLEGNLWWEYYLVEGEPHRTIGAWSKNEQEQANEYPNMLGDVVLYEIEAYLLALN